MMNYIPYSGKVWQGEKFGELGKSSVDQLVNEY